MTTREIARVAHEANRAYCCTLDDFSQPSWNDAPSWQCESAVAGVEALLENPSLTPEDMHQNWISVKVQEGWQYGLEKNADSKTHPCLVPYSNLSPAQRVKDHLFSSVVKALLVGKDV